MAAKNPGLSAKFCSSYWRIGILDCSRRYFDLTGKVGSKLEKMASIVMRH